MRTRHLLDIPKQMFHILFQAHPGANQAPALEDLSNFDSNIKGIDYPILGNDAAVPSIRFFSQAVVEAYKSGQSAPKVA